MNIVIPLAGKDPRFDVFGVPKPLIPVHGKPLLQRCTENQSWLFSRPDSQIIFIVAKSEEEQYGMSDRLKELYGDRITILPIDPTEGAACSVLKAKELINSSEELVIYLADIQFRAPIEEAIEEAQKDQVAGLIPTFKSDNPKYSYAVADSMLEISQVAEKQVISDNASAGLYYFRQGSDFVWAAEQMIKENKRVNNAFYICPVYNQLIQRGDRVKIVPATFQSGLGSPEEIQQFIDANRDRS